MIAAQKQPLLFFAGFFILSLLLAVYTEIYYFTIVPFACLLIYAGWDHIQLFFFILLFSLPFSSEVQLTASLGTDLPDEAIMLLVSFLFFLYWVYNPPALSKKAIGHPLLLLLLISMGWAVVAVGFSTQPLVSIKFLLAKSWYLGAFVLAPLIIFSNKERIRLSMLMLVVSMMIVTVITLVRHFQYGFSFVSINDALQPFFRNHVNYSAMLVCMTPVLLAMYKLSNHKKTRRLIVTAIWVLLAALFFSYSRGAWLALFTGLLAWWLIKRKLLLVSYVAVLIAVFVAVSWIKNDDRYLRYAPDYRSTIFHEDFRQHLTATYQMKDVSTAERFYRWIAGVRMVKDNWLTGVGPGSFYHNYRPYAIPAYKTWVSDNKDHSTVHNYFLLLLIEQGVPGLFFFILLTSAMLYYAQQLYHRTTDIFYKYTSLALGAAMVMLLNVNFLSDLIETDKIGSLFFLCFSLLIAIDLHTRKELQSSSHVERVT